MNGNRQSWRVAVVGIVFLGGIVLSLTQAPFPQDPGYHDFADQRQLLGIPNFWNVLSDGPFLAVGGFGLWALLFGRPAGIVPEIKAAYVWFFLGTALIAFGSAYYHLHPDNETLFWDRLPMTLSFMSFFTVVLGEHISPHFAARSLYPFITIGLFSVVYWLRTEQLGRGDLRPYYLVQFLPMFLIPLILVLYRSSLTRAYLVWLLLGLYVIAKVVEALDARIYGFTGQLSGHTLKHAIAALAMLLVLLGIHTRRRVAESASFSQGV